MNEPPSKRKTLAERAEQFPNALRSSSNMPGNKTGFGARPHTSHSIRNASNASVSTSIPGAGSMRGMRPASRQANGLAASARTNTTFIKPDPDEDDDRNNLGASLSHKGIPQLSFNRSNSLQIRKTRAHSDLRHQHSLQSQSASTRSQHSGFQPCIYDDSDTCSEQTSRNSSASSMSSAPSTHQQQQSGGPVGASQPSREVSLSTAFADLSLSRKSSRHSPTLERIKEEVSPSKIPKFACAPNTLRHTQSVQALRTPSPLKQKSSMPGLRTPVSNTRRRDRDAAPNMPIFLTKEKLTPVKGWDVNVRLETMMNLYQELKGDMSKATDNNSSKDQAIELLKTQTAELKEENRDLGSSNRNLSSDLERARNELHMMTTDLQRVQRDFERLKVDMERKHEREIADLRMRHEKEESRQDREREKEAARFSKEMEDAKTAWKKEKDEETMNATSEHWEELDRVRSEYEEQQTRLKKQLDELRQAGESRATESASEVQTLRDTAASLQSQLEASNATVVSLRSRITAYESRITTLEQDKNALISKTNFLQGNQEAQSQEFTNMAEQLRAAEATRNQTLETLRKEEMLRRKLNATILELRGNIRVFVRSRPLLNDEDDPAKIDYVEEDSLEGCKEICVHAPTTQSVTGKTRNEKTIYSFDRIFTPGTPNKAVFQECQDLIQSVVDGYNVSILSYGQTGSGKTYGMTGPEGIIPSAINMLLSEMTRLKEKGWDYAVEANFVEVYNETLNDLLGDAKSWDDADDLGASVRGKKKEKHEIHHDAITGKTTVSNLTAIGLWPPPKDAANWPPAATIEADQEGEVAQVAASYTEKAVNNLLETAAKNRRVAATKANERSSRSHSIFMLTLKGSCAATGQSSEGVLNLVDLAGSERLKQSGAEGSRMKETQAINKSLSSLGDVIAALGNKNGSSEAHVPYRNSKVRFESELDLKHVMTDAVLAHLPPPIFSRRYDCLWQVLTNTDAVASESPTGSLSGKQEQSFVRQQSAWNTHWHREEALGPLLRVRRRLCWRALVSRAAADRYAALHCIA